MTLFARPRSCRSSRAARLAAALSLTTLGAFVTDVAAAATELPAIAAVALAAPGPVGERAAKASRAKNAPRRRVKKRRGTRRAAVRVLPALRYTTPMSAAALSSDLGAMLAARVRSGRWGAMIVSLTRKDTLFAYNPGEAFLPASTMKLLTTAVALDRFGPNYTFSTDVLRDGTLDGGVLQGNLILRGDGDPGLSNRYLPGEPGSPMDSLAHLVAVAGVRRVRGDLIADASGFDEQHVPEGWLPRYLQSGYAARVCALSLNENLVWVAVTPASGRGAASVALEPATTTIPLHGNVRTVSGSGAKVSVRRRADGVIDVSGWIGTRSVPRRYELIVEDPAVFTAGALRAALAARGITVDGAVRVGRTPPGASKVASLPSQPIGTLVSAMNRESINHFAELLFRDAARGPQRNVVGSAQSGAARLGQFLTRTVGIAEGDVTVTDGSGLSVLDRITPRAMVQLLGYANDAPWSSTFHASLPVAGASELLRNRMKYTPAQGNLHAKTGTTNNVISLAGYVTAEDGEVLAFVFFYNGADRWNAKSTIDAMGATLAAFVRPTA